MVNELRQRPKLVAIVLLAAASMAWGANFVVVKDAITRAPVLDFLTWRFVLAGLVLAALRPRALLRLGARGWAQGVALGLTLTGAYLAQTYGLRYTPAAEAGFLTGLQVVFTALLGWAILRSRPSTRTWAAVLVATAGLAVFSLRGVAFGLGEGLTVLSSALFALQIVGLGRWASVEDAYGLATAQLATVGIASLLLAAPGGAGLPPTPSMWGAVVLSAIAATAFGFVAQSWGQSHLSPTAAAVVFTAEPVFAALFAWMAGERLGWATLVGGGLVIGAMLVMGFSTGHDHLGRTRPLRVPRTLRGARVPSAARGAVLGEVAPTAGVDGMRPGPVIADGPEPLPGRVAAAGP